MPPSSPTLHLLCGKIASGKSTLTAKLGAEERTLVIAEDDWLKALYAHEMATIPDYVRCMGKLRAIMGPHVVALLRAGVSVVLDFQANTVEARRWMRSLLEEAGADHQLHGLDVPDEVCLERLRARNAQGDHAFAATQAQFAEITKHFAPPTAEEGFVIEVHRFAAEGG